MFVRSKFLFQLFLYGTENWKLFNGGGISASILDVKVYSYLPYVSVDEYALGNAIDFGSLLKF